jgi:dipeptidyl aminopeptidase/acylaminoacyl peptidase
LFPRQGALLAQRFDADRMTLEGEAWQLAERVVIDQTQGLAMLSASATGFLVYSGRSVEARQRRLVWLDRAGKELQRLDDRDPVNANHIALSPDGRLLAVSRDSIWMLETARGLLTRFTSQQDSTPLWTPDGDRLVFQSTRDGVRNLYQRALSGSEDELLLATPGSKSAHDWSPDGRLLLYREVDPRTGFDLWVLPVERASVSNGESGAGSSTIAGPGGSRGRLQPVPGAEPQPVAHSSAAELNGQFSPDGRWIAYESDESGRFEIYVQPFGRDGTQVRWRGDGTELFYVAPGGRVMAVSVGAAPDGRSGDFGAPVLLFAVRLEAGDPVYPQYVASRDGQRFLVNLVTDAGPGVISAIVNWAPPR